MEAAGLARGPLRVPEVHVAADGTTAAHTLRVDGGAEELRATVAAAGGVRDGVWRGRIERIDVDEPRLGPWRLDAPAAFAVGRNFVTLANSCLLHTSQARWCTQLDMRGRPEDSLVVSGQNFDLATVRPLLPPALELEGVYQLSGALLDLMGEPRGAIALNSSRTRARVAFGDEQAFTAEFDRIQAGMTLTDGALELTAAVRSTTGGRAEVVATIANARERDSPIDGRLHVEWPDLAFLTVLSPALGEVGGALAGDLTVAGTVAEPTIDGRATVANGRVVVPQWGLVVERIEATACKQRWPCPRSRRDGLRRGRGADARGHDASRSRSRLADSSNAARRRGSDRAARRCRDFCDARSRDRRGSARHRDHGQRPRAARIVDARRRPGAGRDTVAGRRRPRPRARHPRAAARGAFLRCTDAGGRRALLGSQPRYHRDRRAQARDGAKPLRQRDG